MKKIIILFLSILFLFSCGSKTVDNGLISHKGSDFVLDIPSNWSIIDNKQNLLPNPSHGNIEFSLSSKDVKNGFSNNLLILSLTGITEKITSKDFSLANSVGGEKDYAQYKKIDGKDLTFNDGEIGYLHTFEGKYNKSTPKLIFMQTAHICNKNKVFFITMALSSDTTDFLKYENIIKTFKCN